MQHLSLYEMKLIWLGLVRFYLPLCNNVVIYFDPLLQTSLKRLHLILKTLLLCFCSPTWNHDRFRQSKAWFWCSYQSLCLFGPQKRCWYIYYRTSSMDLFLHSEAYLPILLILNRFGTIFVISNFLWRLRQHLLPLWLNF